MRTFVADLVFAREEWRTVESRSFPATHPEIAYHLAMVSGAMKRYAGQFLGLADLYVQDRPQILGGRMELGDGDALVVAKDGLPIFNDPKWRGVKYVRVDPASAVGLRCNCVRHTFSSSGRLKHVRKKPRENH